MNHYLSTCAIYRDEAPYLREWIEFHRLVGVEHFFLYDNGSSDDHATVLAPYARDGVVEVCGREAFGGGQLPAYEHCLAHHRGKSRWIAFLDLDEFLFSPMVQPLPELLVDYDRWPGVVANWAVFGTSGREAKPDGLVIESYLQRSTNERLNSHVKSIVDPSRVERPGENPHFFHYADGRAVDENFHEVEGPPYSFTPSVSFERLRVNHYYTKSQAEFEVKLKRPKAHGRDNQIPVAEASRLSAAMERLNELRDEAILPYVPALKERLELRQPR